MRVSIFPTCDYHVVDSCPTDKQLKFIKLFYDNALIDLSIKNGRQFNCYPRTSGSVRIVEKNCGENVVYRVDVSAVDAIASNRIDVLYDIVDACIIGKHIEYDFICIEFMDKARIAYLEG